MLVEGVRVLVEVVECYSLGLESACIVQVVRVHLEVVGVQVCANFSLIISKQNKHIIYFQIKRQQR